MRVRYTTRALADLDSIYEYLYPHNPTAASSVLVTIRQRVAQLADFPFMGMPTLIPGTRYLTVSRYPYKIYYRVRGSIVSIVHIRDGRRAPWKGHH
jgi:addiction module RelE/StbE family toxin